MNLSVIWRLQDAMTPVMNRVSRTARGVQDVLDRVNASIGRGFARSGNSVDSLREKIEALRKYRDGLDIGIDARRIREANGELTILERRLASIENQNNRAAAGGGFMRGFSGLRGLAAGASLYAAVGVGQGIMTDAMSTEKAEATFKYFTKNESKANSIIEKLKAFSEKYAMYNRGDLMQSASMIATTMGSDSVMRITEMVAKLAQGNTENFKGIVTRLQQIKGTGYLQGDELMELLNRGVFGLQENIAKFKGISLSQFNKLKEAQLISYNDVETALIRMTSAGGMYANILDVISKTTEGKWQTMKNIVRNKAIEIALYTQKALNGGLDWVLRFFEKAGPISAAFERFSSSFKPLFNGIFRILVAFGLVQDKGDSVANTVGVISSVVDKLTWIMNMAGGAIQWVAGMFEKYPWLKYAVGFVAISYGLGIAKDKAVGFIDKIGAISLMEKLPFAAIGRGFTMIGTAMQFLWANPIGLIVLGVLALGAAIYYAWNHSETFRRITIQTWEGLKYLWNGAVGLVMEAWAKISPIFTAISLSWSVVMAFFSSSTQIMANWVSEKFGFLGRYIMMVFEKMKPYFSKFWTWFKDAALTAIRATVAVATLGLSEVALFLFKKFKIGYDKGAAAAAAYEGKGKPRPKPKGPGFNLPNFNPKYPQFGPDAGGAGGAMPDLAGLSKAGGLQDTIDGSASKQVTINLNSKIADINNYFQSTDNEESSAKKIADAVLRELNRIILTGDRLAIE